MPLTDKDTLFREPIDEKLLDELVPDSPEGENISAVGRLVVGYRAPHNHDCPECGSVTDCHDPECTDPDVLPCEKCASVRTAGDYPVSVHGQFELIDSDTERVVSVEDMNQDEADYRNGKLLNSEDANLQWKRVKKHSSVKTAESFTDQGAEIKAEYDKLKARGLDQDAIDEQMSSKFGKQWMEFYNYMPEKTAGKKLNFKTAGVDSKGNPIKVDCWVKIISGPNVGWDEGDLLIVRNVENNKSWVFNPTGGSPPSDPQAAEWSELNKDLEVVETAEEYGVERKRMEEEEKGHAKKEFESWPFKILDPKKIRTKKDLRREIYDASERGAKIGDPDTPGGLWFDTHGMALKLNMGTEEVDKLMAALDENITRSAYIAGQFKDLWGAKPPWKVREAAYENYQDYCQKCRKWFSGHGEKCPECGNPVGYEQKVVSKRNPHHRGYDLPETTREDEERLEKEHEKERKLVQQAGDGLDITPEAYMDRIMSTPGSSRDIALDRTIKHFRGRIPADQLFDRLHSRYASLFRELKNLGKFKMAGTDKLEVVKEALLFSPLANSLPPKELEALAQSLVKYMMKKTAYIDQRQGWSELLDYAHTILVRRPTTHFDDLVGKISPFVEGGKLSPAMRGELLKMYREKKASIKTATDFVDYSDKQRAVMTLTERESGGKLGDLVLGISDKLVENDLIEYETETIATADNKWQVIFYLKDPDPTKFINYVQRHYPELYKHFEIVASIKTADEAVEVGKDSKKETTDVEQCHSTTCKHWDKSYSNGCVLKNIGVTEKADCAFYEEKDVPLTGMPEPQEMPTPQAEKKTMTSEM
jgi:hypothetical protein